LNRVDGRNTNQIRPTSIKIGIQDYAEGSVLIETGQTKVICAASIDEKVPPFLRGQGRGWVTAEYNMLPRATHTRTSRERSLSSGRTHEIQRLIGRSLRAVCDLEKIGERSINIDCDVLQADGGTRTASITGAYVALYQALLLLVQKKALHHVPLKESVAATSVGILNDVPVLDLCYEEDFKASVDLNVVMTDSGEFVEVQGTAEESPFSREMLSEMLDLATAGIKELHEIQRVTISDLSKLHN
tara:strand:+ start:12851 stop:13582 length:732 start_codon:yes stop_codon:yes gene_type:complete